MAGRIILAKSILQAILNYYMQVATLPSKLVKDMEKDEIVYMEG